MELNCIVEVLHKTSGDCGIEGHGGEASKYIGSIEAAGIVLQI